MKYQEIIIIVYLKRNIMLNQVGEAQGALIKNVMKKSNHLAELHSKKGVKLYCFDYLYPRAENKQFHQERVYFFKLRTPIKETAVAFSKALSGFENEDFLVVSCQLSEKVYHHKTELYTSTPAVCTLGSRYWKYEDGMETIEEKIEKNLVTKYTAFFGTEPTPSTGFIKYLNLKNEKPIMMKYKAGSLIGNKFLIGFGSDLQSTQMAYLAYTTSVLEKASSMGSGFCI